MNSLAETDWICPLCCSNGIRDEYHYIMNCKPFDTERKQFLQNYCCSNPNTLKLDHLFNTSNIVILEKNVKFIKTINVRVRLPC